MTADPKQALRLLVHGLEPAESINNPIAIGSNLVVHGLIHADRDEWLRVEAHS